MSLKAILLPEEDAEIIRLLQENETTLVEFIERKEDYIADLEYKLDQLQEAIQTLNTLRQDMQDVLNTAYQSEALTLKDIKKAIGSR